MALFQKPARTPEEAERDRPLGLVPEDVANLGEDDWYRDAYRGDDVPQLTVRSVLMGSGLGFLLAFTNLYIGLKTGWHLGVAITACFLSYAIWNGLLRVGIARTPMSILENNCMQSTASAAGYSTGGAMVSAIAALLILSSTPENPGGQHLPWAVLMGWTFFTAVLGVVMAIPMKRNMINVERLRFPSGLAAAVTLQSLYTKGGEALRKAHALFWAALVGGLTPLLMDLKVLTGTANRRALVPDSSPVFDRWLPVPGASPDTGKSFVASDWTVVFDHKLVMIAAGALIGLRISISMLIGALAVVYILGPAALEAGAASAPGSAWREIGVWLGAPMMVASGLLSFAFQWRTIGRAFARLRRGKREATALEQHKATVEVPASWFVTGVAIAGLGLTWMAHVYFQVPWQWGALAVVLTYFLALVACRATGESDITPTGAMGKIVQLTYGILIPQNATANLMTAAISSGAAGASADLLTDLKSGYLLGANPRRQFLAQFLGIFSGTIATVIGFYLLVPDATALVGTADRAPEFAAPAAQAWLAVARVFQKGIEQLHPMAQQAIIVGLAIGTALTLAERWLPPKVSKWLPSATGLGLGVLLPFQYPLSMLIGAVAAWLWHYRNEARARMYTVPLSSGIVAGESIVGVTVAALNNFWLSRL